jgi:hypothetical protein
MRALLPAVFVALCVISPARSLEAQLNGAWDVPCDGSLPPRFSAPFAHGVIYGGKEFVTSWVSVLPVRPLPSNNWYAASPNIHPLSEDGASRWVNAGVLVRCWVERNPYFITHHRDPIGYRGTVRPAQTACGGGGGPEPGGDYGELGDAGYDPYDPVLTLDVDDCGSGSEPGGDSGSGTQFEPGDGTGGETVDWGSGIGNGGTSACGDLAVVEYVCIDTWDESAGAWVEWGCGYATTC